MHLFWWQQLPLLILFQILESNSIMHKLYVEALVARKSTIGHSSGRIGRYLCLRPAIANRYLLNDPGVVSLSPRRHHPLFLQTEIIRFSPSKFVRSNSLIEFQEKLYESSNRMVSAAGGGNNGVPTLTPLASVDDKKPRKQKVAAIVGGVGAAVLVIVIVVLLYICLMRIKKFLRHSSETASSLPSPFELARGNNSPFAAAQSPFDTQNLRQLSIVELEHATRNFSQSNIIGEGVFGLVYKGLLLDGSIVAIKRYLHKPFPDFAHQGGFTLWTMEALATIANQNLEVKHIASVHHNHLVDLIGYCEDRHQQLLVYDYIANGNVGNYLYDSEGLPIGKLDMRQRLLISLGAAKGLQYLHSLDPPLLHMRFKTSNVLLGDKFTKVSDYGVLKLITDGHRAGSSSAIDCFLDPELNLSKNFSEQSDVYSFGVFLLELISGREANGKYQSDSGQNLVQEARECTFRDFVDKSLEGHTMEAASKMVELALECVDISSKRPSMTIVVQKIEQIQGGEMGYFQAELGEEIGSVTLGSELFK